MAVVNVRDAVTEAALTIGQKAVACQCGLRGRVEVSQRQLQAEQAKSKQGGLGGGGAGQSKNPKLVAIQKQHKRLEVFTTPPISCLSLSTTLLPILIHPTFLSLPNCTWPLPSPTTIPRYRCH